MATVTPGTQFIGLASDYPTKQLRSALINSQSSAYTIEDINSSSSGQAIYTNGFTIAGAINTNIVLPTGATVNYTGPLSMGAGYILTIPTGTILNIL